MSSAPTRRNTASLNPALTLRRKPRSPSTSHCLEKGMALSLQVASILPQRSEPLHVQVLQRSQARKAAGGDDERAHQGLLGERPERALGDALHVLERVLHLLGELLLVLARAD